MALRPLLPLLLALASLLACREEGTPVAPPEMAPGGAAPVLEPRQPAPPPPVEAPFDAVAIGPGGERVPLAADGSTSTVPQDARLELHAPQAFHSLRVRLFDENERLVPTRDEIAIGQGTTVRIAPTEPLEPGSTYRILVDDAREDRPRDVEGTAWLPRSIRFGVAAPANGAAGSGAP